MAGFILRALIAALGLWAATELFKGSITIDNATTLIFARILLGLVNAVVRPFVLLLSLPALLFTLGLFLLAINAATLGLVAAVLPGLRSPGGSWTAVGGALVVSIVGGVGSWFSGARGRVEVIRRKG